MVHKSSEQFPPLSNREWWEKIRQELKGKNPDSLNWQTPESFVISPFYTLEDQSSLPFNLVNLAALKQSQLNPDNLSQTWKTIIPVVCDELGKANAFIESEISSGERDFFLTCENTLPTSDFLSDLYANYQQQPIQFYLSSSLSEHIDTLSLPTPQSTFIPSRPAVTYSAQDFEKQYTFDMKWVYEEGGTRSLQLAVALSSFVDLYDQLSHTQQLTLLSPERKISFHITGGTNLLLEIAKFRAFHLLWDHLRHELGLQYLPQLTLIAHTSLRDLASWDIHNNIIRNTLIALGAIWGGCHGICLYPHSMLKAETDPFATRVARNISYLLQKEAHLHKVVNPVEGAFYLEQLTLKMARKTWDIFTSIEEKGGTQKAWEQGWISSQVQEGKEKAKQLYKEGRYAKIGVTHYPPENTFISEGEILELF